MSAKAFYNSPEWREFRLPHLTASRYTCPACKNQRRTSSVLVVHHKRSVRDRPDLALDERNVIPLCRDCHDSLHRVHKHELLVQLLRLLRDPHGVARVDFGPMPEQLALGLQAANDDRMDEDEGLRHASSS